MRRAQRERPVALPAPATLPSTGGLLSLAAASPEIRRQADQLYTWAKHMSWATVADVIERTLAGDGISAESAAHRSLNLTLLWERYRLKAIERIEPAFYALTSWHAPWRNAGRIWLAPWASTYLRDWLDARPATAAFAAEMQLAYPGEIPRDWFNSLAKPPLLP